MEQRWEREQTDTREPGEIVEIYRQPQPQEVVETYSCPLPWLEQAPRTEREPSAAVPQKPLRPKNRKKGLWIFLGFVAVTVVVAVGAGLWASWNGRENDVSRRKSPFEWYRDEVVDDTERDEITIPIWEAEAGTELQIVRNHGEPLTIQEIYQRVNPAVVTVMAQLDETVSVGTGVIFTEDGYLLTNYHVVEGGQECMIVLDNGYSCDAMYVAGDAANDLAILKVQETGLPMAEFGDSDALLVGDPAYAIGNPLGMELRGTLTDGIISAINRDVQVEGRTMTLLQTNAALNTGNSGGPLINQYGQVVGINVIKMSSSYSNVEGLGFAIPSASIDRMVNDLLTFGEIKPEPLLGITVISIAEEAEEGVWGLLVQSVSPDGAGERAGVQAGDYVLSADGQELKTSQDLLRIRREHYVGDELPLVIWRDGKRISVTLQLKDSVAN